MLYIGGDHRLLKQLDELTSYYDLAGNRSATLRQLIHDTHRRVKRQYPDAFTEMESLAEVTPLPHPSHLRQSAP